MTSGIPAEERDPKRRVILTAARTALARHGFRRCSMEMIARQAGMSRPALYLHFANREAILRALGLEQTERAEQALRAALQGKGRVEDRLAAAFAALRDASAEPGWALPQEADLPDRHGVPPDVAQEGQARLCAVLADWLRTEAVAGRLRLALPPDHAAGVMLAALRGIATLPPPEVSRALRSLAQMLGRGLTPLDPAP
ncbi:MAG TPA: TetR/AcrR family transcriptional regulator [Citreicella sp.]|nr:TetR/AcrR family transcriptional regulator [Citreicella sp.]